MKTLRLILIFALLASAAPAAILKVASDGTQPYDQVSPAIAAATAGDTILVMAGAYGGFTVDRKVTIIGAGTGTEIGENGTLIEGIVEVIDGADSTELRSLWIRAWAGGGGDGESSILRIQDGAMGIFVWRCFVENTSHDVGPHAVAFVSVGAGADFVQCTLWNSAESGRYGILYRTDAHITLMSCLLAECPYALYVWSGDGAGTSLSVQQCVFTAWGVCDANVFGGQAYGIVENSAFMLGPTTFYSQYYNAPNLSYRYCASTHQVPPGETNFNTTAAAFVNWSSSNARTSNFHLAEGSNLIDAGNPDSPTDRDGSPPDLGIFGGQHPYVEGGIPDYPFVVRLDVPYTAPLNGTIQIWGKGRVGPGY